MADQVTERRTIILEIDGRKMQAGIDSANKSLDKTAGAVSKIKDSFEAAKAAAAGFFIGSAIRQFADYSDKATTMDNALKSLTTSTISVAEAQDALFKIANTTGSSVESVTEVYARMSRALGNTGATSQQVLQVVETLGKAFKITGVSSENAASAMLQLSQAFASGRLQGDEFRSVSENAPIVLDLVAKSLNVTTGELKAMSSAGQITSDVVFKALIEGGKQIDEQFKNVAFTFQDLGTILQNFIIRQFQIANKEWQVFNDHVNELSKAADRAKGDTTDLGQELNNAGDDADKVNSALGRINETLAEQNRIQKELQNTPQVNILGQTDTTALDAEAKKIEDLTALRARAQEQLNEINRKRPAQATTAANEYLAALQAEADYEKRFQEGQEKDREDIAKTGTEAFEQMLGARDAAFKKHATEQKRTADKIIKDQQAFTATLNELANKGREYEKKAAEARDKREQEAFTMFDAIGKEVEAQDAEQKKILDTQKALMDAATNTPWDGVIDDVTALQKTLQNYDPKDFTLALAQGLTAARDVINETFTTLSALSEGNFGLQKGLALAQAIINGALAVTKIFAEVPPPASFALAGLIAGVTAAQVALISQQEPSRRATGGAVSAGRRYEVGENRPELYLDNSGRQILIPHANGRIMPNAAMRSDVNIINNGPPLQVVRKTQRDDGGVDIVVAAVKATEDRFEQSMMTGQGKFANSIQRHTNVRRQL